MLPSTSAIVRGIFDQSRSGTTPLCNAQSKLELGFSPGDRSRDCAPFFPLAFPIPSGQDTTQTGTYQKRKHWEILFPGRDTSSGHKTLTKKKRKGCFEILTLLRCSDFLAVRPLLILVGLGKMALGPTDTTSALQSEQQNRSNFFTNQM